MRLSIGEKRALVETLAWSSRSCGVDRELDKLVKRGLVGLEKGIFHERCYRSLESSRPLALKFARELGATTQLLFDRHAADAEAERVRLKRKRAWPCQCWACISRREYEKQTGETASS